MSGSNGRGSALDKKQLMALKQQNESLSQFIIRLSKFYEGITPDLDKEMQTLRSHLSGKPDYTLATVSIGKLNKMLMENSDFIRSASNKSISRLEEAVKKLQTMQTVTEEIKSESAQFLTALDQVGSSIYDTLPQFEKALALYQKAVGNSQEKGKSKGTPESTSNEGKADVFVTEPDADTASERVSNSLHAHITAELRELVEKFYQADKNDPQLRDVRQRLMEGLTPDELMQCCLILIRVIVKDVIKEAGVAERFVTGMHKSLVKMNSNVSQTLTDTQARYEDKRAAMDSLADQIQEMDDAVQGSADIDALKAQANEYLARMNNTLSARREADKADEELVVNLLQSMQDELSRMQKQTDLYRKKLHRQRKESQLDPLTKVANRFAYNERMVIEFERFKRTNSPLSVALLDIDHFKGINDKYGHAAGDKTLVVIARHIKTHIRATDFVARWGGEEFVILFPDTDKDDLTQPLETIRKELAKLPFTFRDSRVSITASLGATTFRENDTIDSVFERADKNLYQAKSSGRNKVIQD